MVDLFHSLDTDASGTVDAAELAGAFAQHGVEATLDEVVELLDTLDEDGDNNIDKHEFLRQMRAVQNERRRRARAARGTSTNGNSISSTPVATGPLRRTRQSRAERASAAKKKHIDRLRELS